jgi:serine/threonine-protein kinase
MIAQASEPVTPPSVYRPEIPADLEAIVLRCLEKSPQERFQDTAALAAALATCQCAGRWSRHEAARWWAELDRPASAAQRPTALLERAAMA